MVGLAIDELAAIHIENESKYTVLSADNTSTVSKCYWKDGEYYIRPLAPGGLQENWLNF